MLVFPFVYIACTVIRFCSYTLEVGAKGLDVLLYIGGRLCLCGNLSSFGKEICQKQSRKGRSVFTRCRSKCLFLFYVVCLGGSTVYAKGYPPSKAQYHKAKRAHYVARNKWAIFNFWIWEPAA